MSDLDDGRFRELFEAIDGGYCLCEIIVDEAGTGRRSSSTPTEWWSAARS